MNNAMANQKLNISLSYDVLANLIRSGGLCAADFRCLDQHTKQQVWQICLTSCKQRIHCQEQSCIDCDFHSQEQQYEPVSDLNDYPTLVKILTTSK